MAEEAGARRSHRGALCGRRGAGVRASRRRGTLPGADAGAIAEIRAGATRGEDTPDGIRALRRCTTGEARRRAAGDLQLSGFHRHQWDQPPDRILHGTPPDDRQAQGSPALRYPGEAAAAHVRSAANHRQVAGTRGAGVFPHHAIPGNWPRRKAFRKDVLRMWYQTFGRRSQRSRLTWERFRNGLGAMLPAIPILQSYPHVRFDARCPNIRGKNRVR
jgi:hypothetical protein